MILTGRLAAGATLLLAALVSAGPAGGQGMFSPEYYVGYAADYSKAGKHPQAESYLRDCVRMKPESGLCAFELAKNLLVQGKAAEGQAELQRAYRLDVGLRARAGLASPAPTAPAVVGIGERPVAAPGEAVHTYRVGDAVEVAYAGGWHRGVLAKVEGSGRSVYVTADFTFQGEPRTGTYWYGGLRPAKGSYQRPAPKRVARAGPENACQVRYNACFASSNRCSIGGGCQPDYVAQGMCRQQKILCDATKR